LVSNTLSLTQKYESNITSILKRFLKSLKLYLPLTQWHSVCYYKITNSPTKRATSEQSNILLGKQSYTQESHLVTEYIPEQNHHSKHTAKKQKNNQNMKV